MLHLDDENDSSNGVTFLEKESSLIFKNQKDFLTRKNHLYFKENELRRVNFSYGEQH